MRVLEETPELGEHRAGSRGTMPGGQIGDEPVEPGRWFTETGRDPRTADESSVRVLLEAGGAQPQAAVLAELAARRADPRWLLALTRT